MSLSVQNDAGGEGGGDTINPAAVQMHLIAICMDTNIGQGTTTGDLIQVTYTGTAASAPATRISTLVSTNFNVPASGPDIIILGVGPNFTLLDGTVLCGNGVTISPTAPPVAPAQVNPDNPTQSVYVVYDTTNGNGGGILVRAPGGSMNQNTYATPTPNTVVLYHELSHAFRLAQSRGQRGVAPQQADDEVPAIQDENILRPLLGIGLRDTNPPHDGVAPSCGGATGTGGCCIVASIATGSAYSDEVNALRRIRELVLRRSDIGYDFFQHLHDDYYSFSPEVCRLMGRSAALQERVRLYFVGPLSRILGLAYRYTAESVDAAELGRDFVAQVGGCELAELGRAEIEEARALLGSLRRSDSSLPPLLADFAAYLNDQARESAYIGWALLEPIEICLAGVEWRLEGLPPEELGRRLARAFDEWAIRLPLTAAWRELSQLGLVRELQFLKRVLLREAAARLALGQRLAEVLADTPERLTILVEEGFLEGEDRS